MRNLISQIRIGAFGAFLLTSELSHAEVRVINASGEYRMGDNDTRSDAKRLALLDAQRIALEKAGIYIESITEVKNFGLAKEEIRSYTAGIVEILEHATRTHMDGETTVIQVDVTTKIDTDLVAQQIKSLLKNEDLREKLRLSQDETAKLRQMLDDKTRELMAANSRAEAEALAKQRQALITQSELDSLIVRARVVLAGSKGSMVIVGTSTPESRKHARSLLEQVLSYDPDNTEAQALLAFVQFEEGQRVEAIATLRGIAKREPLSAHAHKNLGVILQASRDWWGAMKEYQTAIKLEPSFADAHAALGEVMLDAAAWLYSQPEENQEDRNKMKEARRKLKERAVDEFRQATRLTPRNSRYHRELGEALYSLSYSRNFTRLGIKEEEVEEEMIAAIKQDQEEGLAELRRAVELDPADPAAHRALAERLSGEEAIAEYRAAIRIDPADAYSRVELGKRLLLRGEKEVTGAVAQFEAAVRIEPKNAEAHLQLGFVYEDKLSQLDKAIAEYRKSVDLGFDVLPPLYYRVSVLSRALAKAGHRGEAVMVIRDYLRLEPEGEAFFRPHLLELEGNKEN